MPKSPALVLDHRVCSLESRLFLWLSIPYYILSRSFWYFAFVSLNAYIQRLTLVSNRKKLSAALRISSWRLLDLFPVRYLPYLDKLRHKGVEKTICRRKTEKINLESKIVMTFFVALWASSRGIGIMSCYPTRSPCHFAIVHGGGENMTSANPVICHEITSWDLPRITRWLPFLATSPFVLFFFRTTSVFVLHRVILYSI